jgi:uncharacterized protein (TIGR02145 family)
MNILFTYARRKLGLLYSRPVIEDPRELAPEGWRVAEMADYMDLITFYGGEALAGADLKALPQWTTPNEGATAESLFKAKPAGTRSETGIFSGIFINTIFWIK